MSRADLETNWSENSPSKLQGNTLGFLDAAVMSIAGSAPGYTIAASTAAILAAVGFAAPAALLYCALPMTGIAVAYFQLNKVGANAGAAYAWVGKVLHPVLGFLCGWTLLMATTIACVVSSLPAGSLMVSLFSEGAAQQLGWVTIAGSVMFLAMAYFVARGVRVTAVAQWIMSGVEVLLLVVIGILAFIHAGKSPHQAFSWSWLGFEHFSGVGAFGAGALIAAVYYFGWDVSSNLSEETENSQRNSGLGGVVGVLTVFVLYMVFTIVITMTIPYDEIQANPGNILSVLGDLIWPGVGGKMMLLAVMLSTVATLETTLIQISRSIYAMARDKTLPGVLAAIHPRWKTPVRATVLASVIVVVLFAASNFVGSVGSALSTAISAIGLQIAIYYGLAAVAAVVAFRKHLLDSISNFIFMGVFPLGGGLFMLWIFAESLVTLDTTVTVVGLGAIGLGIVPLVAFWKRSPYFHSQPTLGRERVSADRADHSKNVERLSEPSS